MRRGVFVIALMLLLPCLATALDCDRMILRNMMVPAVNNDGSGQIVGISLEIKPGDGTAYIATAPIVGEMTQTSSQTAMHVATGIAGYNASTCDALFKVGTGELTSIDGPSAGAAMTLMILSALRNETLPYNFTMTGTIEPNGIVGPVGGVPEKAQAAASEGIPLFITPYLGIEDRIMLDALKDNVDMTIAQVQDIRQAEALVLGTLGPGNFSNPKLAKREVPQVKPIESIRGEKFALFEGITRDIITSSSVTVGRIPASKEEYASYFVDDVAIAKNALDNGYLYTGANTAFIAGINAEFLLSDQSNREQIQGRIARLDECYKRALDARMSEGNWEWVIGGQLRASWARNKIAKVNDISFQDDVRRLSTLKDVVYAEAWCDASGRILEAKESGKVIEQTKFKMIAARAISEADEYLAGREGELTDQAWHLETAEQEFADGLYGAAVYDATYALYMAKGFDDFDSLGNSTVLDEGEARNYESIWAGLYQSQMKYLRATGDGGRVSLQLLEYAEGLENRTNEMTSALGEERQVVSEPASSNSGNVILVLIGCTLLALVFVVKEAMTEK